MRRSSQPENAMPLLRLAGVQARSRITTVRSRRCTRRSRCSPTRSQRGLALAGVYVAAGRIDAGSPIAASCRSNIRLARWDYAVEGELLIAQKNWRKPRRRSGGARARTDSAARLRLYMALQAAGKQDQATAMAQQWHKEHPKDVLLRSYQGQQSAGSRRTTRRRAALPAPLSRSSPTTSWRSTISPGC